MEKGETGMKRKEIREEIEDKIKEGEVIGGKYEVIEVVGSGGSGIVYKVFDRNLDCYRAVKAFYNKEGEMDVLEKEISFLRELNHPAFPSIIDYMEVDGRKYLVMDYIEGITLDIYIKKYGKVNSEQAVFWAIELAEVLEYLHRSSDPIIYQDMKPSNVIINAEGKIKLIDFGSAQLKYCDHRGREHPYTGTYGYGAPEQFGYLGKETADEKSDVYGLGMTLHYMLTGNDPSCPPFIVQPLRFYDASLSAGLEKIIEKSTQAEKGKRYAGISPMKEALKRQRTSEKRWRYVYNVVEGLYYMLLFLLGGMFLNLCGYVKDGIKETIEITGYRERVVVIAGGVLLLCLCKYVWDKIYEHFRKNIRQLNAVYLSAKRNKGLIVIVCVAICIHLFASPDTVYAKEELLPVVVRNEEGQKILIRYDAQYSPKGAMRMEVPSDYFLRGEDYELTVECVRIRTNEKKSRTFYLKSLEP